MKQKIPLERAERIAQRIIERISTHCLRIETAGSIRRGKAEVGDIEIVAQPFPTFDMFNSATYEPHELDGVDWTMFGRLIKGGHKYKQVELPHGINLDLFIVTPPAQWGVQFLIRTGPAEFSHRLVTKKSAGGMLPSNLRVQDGAIWSNNHIIETPQEADVFDVLGIPFIQPKDRV